MKYVITLFSILSFGLLTNFSDLDCTSLKKGKWVVKVAENPEHTTYIDRKGEYQIESTPGIGLTIKSKITWQSDCAYSISDITIEENENNIEFPPGYFDNTIFFTVTKITDSYYIAQVQIEEDGSESEFMEIKYQKY